MDIEELADRIRAQVDRSPVHVFMKGTPDFPRCGFSKAVCDVFRTLDVAFTATDVLEDLDLYRAALGKVTDWPTIPQVFVNGEFVGGCDITVEMYRSGDLQKLVLAQGPDAAGEAPVEDAS
jgi:monothiol glutaredoxin